MEKPSPTYDIASRYAHTMREDTEKTDRFYDRMALRGIAVLRDSREEDQPVWRGDHSYNSDAATYSLMHFIEPEVAREHPDWTQVQIHADAIDRFQKRLAQDLSYERGEIAHEESVVRWRPVETKNGIELATEYGDTMVTLQELWEHTKEYAAFAGNPAAYNSQEHEAQLRMQETLINGTSHGFVSVLSHPDGVRYVQIWQTSDAGDVISQHVDLYAATGRDFTPEEAKDLIYHLSDFHASNADAEKQQHKNSYAHFFWREGSVNAEDVRTIAIAQSVYSSDRVYERETVSVSRRRKDSGVVVNDIGNGMRQAGRFLAVEIEEKIRAIGSIASRPEIKRSTKPAAAAGKEKRSVPVRVQVLPVSEKSRANETHSESVSSAHTGKEGLKSAMAEWWISKTMLAYAGRVPAAPNAILYWFTRIAESKTNVQIPEKMFMPEPHGKPGVAPEHKALLKRREAKNAPDAWNAFIDRIKKSVGLRAPFLRRERFPERANKKEYGNDAKRFVVPKPGETRPEISLIAVYYAAATLLSRFFTQPELPRSPKLPKEIVRVRIRQEAKGEPERASAVSLGRLMFAIVVWWMYGVSPEAVPAKTVSGGRASKETNKKPEETEETNPSENPVWILLSIIWQLAMIRESALSGSQVPAANQQTSSRPKRKRKHAALPQHGIIFAFAS